MNTSPPFNKIITMTTDFGLEDAYVGAMKGVMLNIHRHLSIVDISHHLPPHRILPAALMLREACPRFPEGTIHVAVIDPGVGGDRMPVLLKIQNHYYLGPDNGIFGLLVNDFSLEGAWKLDNPRYFLPVVSNTFHGRDVFAPVAAHLASGVLPDTFGPKIAQPITLTLPPCVKEEHRLNGEIIWIDRFGNCISNLTKDIISDWSQGSPFWIQAASGKIERISPCYETTPAREPLALYGSTGYLEIACNRKRADQTLGLQEGDPVTLHKR